MNFRHGGLPRAIVLIAVWMTLCGSVFAHTRSQSFSSWKIKNGSVWMLFTVQSHDAKSLLQTEVDGPALASLLLEHLDPRIGIAADGEACRRVAAPRSLRTRKGYLRTQWRFACSPGTSMIIIDNAFFEQIPQHIHYARVSIGERPPVDYLLSDAKRTVTIAGKGRQDGKSQGASLWNYVLLGIEHILIGVDHLAFLAALLLLCRSVREIVFMVTGFTIGHSITLSLAVLGIMEPNSQVIEALIGFTIALVAIENISVTTESSRSIALISGSVLFGLALLKLVDDIGPPAVTLFGLSLFAVCYLLLSDSRDTAARLRPALTLLFGLIHGFGFASVLMEIGLPTGRLAAALFGFNIGVEIGQLAVVAGLAILGKLLIQDSTLPRFRAIGQTVSAVLCSLGLYWFIQRGYAL